MFYTMVKMYDIVKKQYCNDDFDHFDHFDNSDNLNKGEKTNSIINDDWGLFVDIEKYEYQPTNNKCYDDVYYYDLYYDDLYYDDYYDHHYYNEYYVKNTNNNQTTISDNNNENNYYKCINTFFISAILTYLLLTI